MSNNWGDKFKKKLHDKELASQETKKSFHIYKDAAAKLFDDITDKVKDIEQISVVRTMVGQSTPTPGPIKALNLKCNPKYLRFVPEGINLDDSRGRIRIEHNCKSLAQFIYMHLTTDPKSQAVFPENLLWKLNAKGEDVENYETLPDFDDPQLEKLIETCFLE